MIKRWMAFTGHITSFECSETENVILFNPSYNLSFLGLL